jgi:iron complex outermembrane receptor protein
MNMPLSARALSRRSKASALAALSLLSLLPAARLGAQNNPAPAASAKDDVIVLDAFTVSADNADRYRAADAISAVRVRAPLIDTPSSISVITREMMDDLGPNRVFDVTRYVAGVQEGRGVQFQDRMIIRGFETQNGARTVDNFLQSADSDNIDESVIDRIEVTKGPNAILSPSGAPGGSLNIITKSPTFRKQRSFSATIGFFDAQKYMFDVADTLNASKSVAYRVVLSGQDSERYWGNESYIKGSAFAPMLAWKLSEKTLLTVKLVAAEHRITREPLFILDPSTTSTSGEPKLLPGISPSELNGIQPWSHVETHSADVFATLTSSLNEHISYRIAANGRYMFEDHDQNFLSTPGLSSRYNPTTGQLTQDYTWAVVNGVDVSTFSPWIDPAHIPNRGQIQWTRRKTGNVQADIVGNYQFGDISSQTVAGLAWSRQQADSRVKDPGPMPDIDLSKPHAKAYPNYPAALTQNTLSTYTNTQVFVNQRFGFFGDKLYVTGGILRYGTKTASRNALSTPTNAILDDDRNMWSASVLYKIRPNLSLYASRSNNASPVIANNLPLWRAGDQDEFGFKTEWLNQKLSINGAYFEISQTNVTVPNPAFQTDPTQPQTLVSDLTNHGWELEVMGAVTKNISILGSYSSLKMRDALGRMVRAVADSNASALVNYRFTDGALAGLSVNAGIVYNGKRAGDVPDGNFTARNVVKQVSFYLEPQYSTTLGFNYVWNQTYTTRLTIDNVLDDKDFVSVAGGRISGTGLATQPGRNVRLTTTIKF